MVRTLVSSPVTLTQLLGTASLEDFTDFRCLGLVGGEQSSALLCASCSIPDLPAPDKAFALRVGAGAVGRALLAESRVLARVPPHPLVQRPLVTFRSSVQGPLAAALAESGCGLEVGTPIVVAVSGLAESTLAGVLEGCAQPLPYPHFLQLGVDLLSAVAACSEAGVCHGSLHPGIVTVRPGLGLGTPSLTTFTTASCCLPHARDKWSKPAGLGSPRALDSEVAGFMAPELRNLWAEAHTMGSSAADFDGSKADVWSVAAMLLFAATGSEVVSGYAGADFAAGYTYSLEEVSDLPTNFPASMHGLLRWMLHPDAAERLTATAALAKLQELAPHVRPAGVAALPGLAPAPHTLFPSRRGQALLRGTRGSSSFSPVPAGAGDGGGDAHQTGLVCVRTLTGAHSVVRFAAKARVSDVLVTAADTLRVTAPLTSCALFLGGRRLAPGAELQKAVPAAAHTLGRDASLVDATALPTVYLVTHLNGDALFFASAAATAAAGAGGAGGGEGASPGGLITATPFQPSVLSLAALGGQMVVPLALQLGLAAGALPAAAAMAGVSSGPSVGEGNLPGLPPVVEESLARPAGMDSAEGGGVLVQKTGGAAAGGGGAPPTFAGGAAGSGATVPLDEHFSFGVLTPAGYVFDPRSKNKNVELSANNTVAECNGKWASVALRMKAMDEGRLVFSVRLLSAESGCGFAIGVACVDGPNPFDPESHSLGAHVSSFAYSKTGKKGGGSLEGFTPYGSPMVTGDIIMCDADVSRGTVRFYRNGMDQGIAFDVGIKGRKLLPVVCLGSNNGGKLTRVELQNPVPMTFDSMRSHTRMQVPTGPRSLHTLMNHRKWATSICAHNGMVRGKMEYSVRLSDVQSGGGVALGVVDALQFDWKTSNLGASEQSWGFSKTGKKGDGRGFVDYGMPFTNGDVVTICVDMDAGTLGFRVNGIDQGIAYGPGAEDYSPANPGLKGRCVVPAVCLGSSDGDKNCKVELGDWHRHYEVARFDPLRCKATTQITGQGREASTAQKWGTVFVAGNPVLSGTYSVGVEITSAEQGCGAAVGVADALGFKPTTANLGASDNSWAYSKTGKASSGRRFERYGEPFGNGDIVTVDIDMTLERIEFYLNGVSQGVLHSGHLASRALVPAVCIGNTEGGLYTSVRLVPPAVIRFDPGRKSSQISLANHGRTAETSQKWASVFALHPGQMSGVLRFAMELQGSGGIAVGIADANHFKPQYQNVGAAEHSWALSKSGKISCGEGWQAYSSKLDPGDIVGVEMNFEEGTLTFYRNGKSLGVAFRNLDGRGYLMMPAVCLGSNYGERESSATFVPLKAAADGQSPFPVPAHLEGGVRASGMFTRSGR